MSRKSEFTLGMEDFYHKMCRGLLKDGKYFIYRKGWDYDNSEPSIEPLCVIDFHNQIDKLNNK